MATAAVALLGLVALVGCGSSGPTAAKQVRLTPTKPSAAALQRQFVDVVKAVSPSVVQIQSQRGLGSGVVFDTSGNVVTNAHVVAGSNRFLVTLADGKRRIATLVGASTGNDLAVVHLNGANPPAATFANSSNVRSGDLALALGNPLGLQSSVTQGIVSSVNRGVTEGRGVSFTAIQTSAAINPGNSGGALVDLSGAVMGIPTLTATDPEFGNAQAPGIGFAIPSNTVKRVASDLIASG